ncbi:MAG: hypothetical protein MZV70_41105 [Desulfobacterales bacterium]|nr:hypothetical protein [Desulfobacterales bacterium]
MDNLADRRHHLRPRRPHHLHQRHLCPLPRHRSPGGDRQTRHRRGRQHPPAHRGQDRPDGDQLPASIQGARLPGPPGARSRKMAG